MTEDVATYSSSPVVRGNVIMFTGRWWDSAAKLYYYRFRDYSPILGRFLQPDPAKYIDGMNLYAYCGNNPINFRDPHVLWIKGAIGAVAGCTGGGILFWVVTLPAAVTAPAWAVPVGVGLVIGGAALVIWDMYDDDLPVTKVVDKVKQGYEDRNKQIDEIISEANGESPPDKDKNTGEPTKCPPK